MKIMILVLSLLWVGGAQSAGLYYLESESVDLSNIPVPPELNSLEDVSELEMVLYYQKIRSEEDCHRANYEDGGLSTSFFGEEYGPLTDAEALKLVELQERLFQEAKYFTKALKEKYPRLRPFKRDSRVVPCIPLQPSDSYPSGHATIAIIAAKTFALIYPGKEQALLERAQVVANDRVLGGVHHPVDVLAGKELGEKIFSALVKEERFLRDVKALTL